MNKSLCLCKAFTLLEVLITLFIISFGMLGIAKLQLIALQDVRQSFFANKASFLLAQMNEHLIANSKALTSYQLNFASNTNISTDCTNSPCTPEQLASFDKAIWQQQLKNELPSGRGQISISGNKAQISIYWDANKDGSTGTNCPKISDADLDCSQVSLTVF